VYDGEQVTLFLGADASQRHDYTALVGTQKGDWTDVRFVRVWKPKRTGRGLLKAQPIDLEATIGAEVLRLHKLGQVGAVCFDPWQLATVAAQWRKAGIQVIEMPQTQQRIEADTALADAIAGGRLRHFRSADLDEAVRNAIVVETPRGMRIAKEKASRKIDALIALSMAHHAAITQRNYGPIQILPANPFYGGPPISDYIEAGGQLVYAPKASHKPHPEGVTWHNCPRRNKGCEACVHELEAEGYFAAQEQELELSLARGAGQPLSADEAWQNLFGPTIERHQQQAQKEYQDAKIVSKFWTNIRRELGSRDKDGL
jgi:hypothetical protein